MYLAEPGPDQLHSLLLAQPVQVQEHVHQVDLAVPDLEHLQLPQLHLLLVLVSIIISFLLRLVRLQLVSFLEGFLDLLEPVLAEVVELLGFLLRLAVDLLTLVVQAALIVEEVEPPQQVIRPETVLRVLAECLSLDHLFGGAEARSELLQDLGFEGLQPVALEQVLVVRTMIQVLGGVLYLVVLGVGLEHDLVDELGVL